MQNKASLEAYSLVKPSIPLCQKAVLKMFKPGDVLCQHDIVKMLGIEINKVNPRVNELVKLGYLMEMGRKNTHYSKVKVTHYSITTLGVEKLKPVQIAMF